MYNQFRNKNIVKNSGSKIKSIPISISHPQWNLRIGIVLYNFKLPMSANMPFTFYLHQSAFRFIVVYVWQCFYDQFKILSLSLE